jgi:hypothetical protein
MTTPEISPELKAYVDQQILKAKAELIVSQLQKPHTPSDELRSNWLSHWQALEDGAYEDIVTFKVAKHGYRSLTATEVN